SGHRTDSRRSGTYVTAEELHHWTAAHRSLEAAAEAW
ncbi:hypothetical protein GA0115246_112121, partial [Streptomyces sp. SolWspMP-sol7th]